MKLDSRLLFVFLIGLFPVFTRAQQGDEVSFQLTVDTPQVAAGGQFNAVLSAQIKSGWHLYSLTQLPGAPPIATSISVPEHPVLKQAGVVQQSPILTKFDENFGIKTRFFEHEAQFEIPVEVSSTAASDTYSFPVKVRFVVCSDTVCLAPQTLTPTTKIRITKAAIGSSPPESNPGEQDELAPFDTASVQVSNSALPATFPPSATARDDESLGESSREMGSRELIGSPDSFPQAGLSLSTPAYIWLAMTWGFLALLTPCVFPMIPITVSYFTKREAVSRRRAVADAGLYSVGIVLTFTLVGFILTFLFGAGGINRLAASPWVNIGIALVFVVFALNLFGAFEIQIPSSWISAVDRKSTATGGVLGILLMALTFSLTSFTCTVPFVGTVMVAATQGDWSWSLIGITVFATVFSAPFFLLAVFPSWLKSLPQSGGWMNSLKITLGFVELAAALKFISNFDLAYQWEFLTRPVFITIWLSIALVITIYLLGWFHFPHEAARESIGAVRVLLCIFFLAVSFYLLRGLFGFPLGELDAFLPPRGYGNSVSTAHFGTSQFREEERWLTSYEQALELARRENRSVFIDFTGYTCTNCRWMEANIFVLAEVRKLLEKYVSVRLYTDGPQLEHEENLRFEKERFGTIALPFYAIVSPREAVIATFSGMTRNKQKFIGFLNRGLEISQRSLNQRSGRGKLISREMRSRLND